MHALLELGCIPCGMELFPAADEGQWSVIQRVIADCDYYILILGGRYGSTGPDGVGYTEMEYKYALAIDKPTIAFLHKNPGDIPSNRCEPTQEGKEKLIAFRALAKKKLCKHWSTPAELGSVVSRSLIQLIKRTPAIGWVRGDALADKDVTLELPRCAVPTKYCGHYECFHLSTSRNRVVVRSCVTISLDQRTHAQVFLHSFGYKYKGTAEVEEGNLYVRLRGDGHEEFMQFIFNEPLTTEFNVLVGVYCAVTEERIPAIGKMLWHKIGQETSCERIPCEHADPRIARFLAEPFNPIVVYKTVPPLLEEFQL